MQLDWNKNTDIVLNNKDNKQRNFELSSIQSELL